MRRIMDTRMKYSRSFTVLFAAMWAGGCMMQSLTPPNEMGPSGFGLALTVMWYLGTWLPSESRETPDPNTWDTEDRGEP